MFGIFQSDVRAKFSKPDHLTTDIDPDTKRVMGETVKAMDKLFNADPKMKAMNWTPVLYVYELYKGHAQRANEYGDSLPASNGNCPLDHDYSELVSLQVQQFFALASYLPVPTPKCSNFKGCLSADDLDSIDAFLGTCNKKLPSQEIRKQVMVGKGQAAKGYDPIFLPPEMTEEPKRHCAGCHELKTAVELKRCAGCKAVFYCSRKCQVEHWAPYHKAVCKPTKPGKKK
ncbi:hypothetical protein JCM11641_007247 [Rhodosporidiobolus odoratus]